MKKRLLILMLLCLPILSSCSTKTEPVVIYQVEKVYIPYSLLQIDCHLLKAGGTPRLVSAAYLSEKSCRKAYQKLVKDLMKDYTEEGQVNDRSSNKQD